MITMKEKIKMAEDAVADITDATLKTKAFEIVLHKLLADEVAQQTNSNQSNSSSNTVTQVHTVDSLSQAAGISLEQLNSVFDIDGESIHTIAAITGTTESKKQGNAVLVTLTAKSYLQDQKEMKATEINQLLTDLGIGSLNNLAKNLKSFENYLVMKGDSKSTTTYRITQPGIKRGLELIKEMVK